METVFPWRQIRLVGVALQCDALAENPASVAASKNDKLVQLRKTLEEQIREARRSIWGLRDPKLHARDLAGTLRVAGEDATAEQHIGFDFTATGAPRACRAEANDSGWKPQPSSDTRSTTDLRLYRSCIRICVGRACRTALITASRPIRTSWSCHAQTARPAAGSQQKGIDIDSLHLRVEGTAAGPRIDWTPATTLLHHPSARLGLSTTTAADGASKYSAGSRRQPA